MFGQYVLLEKLGAGGMAEVFRAERRGSGDFVKSLAIKRILRQVAANPRFVERFADEARIAASLEHRNIVSIHDFGQVDGQLYIVMELVEGWNLAQVLERLRAEHRPLPLRHALYLALEICKGLQAAHGRVVDGKAAPVAHRNVSPQNVLVSLFGEVKLGDFGLAQAVTHLEGRLGAPADPRADIFDLGAVLYELLTCQKPEATAAPPPGTLRPKLPPEVDALVMRALERDPAAGYQGIKWLGLDLSRFLLATRLDAGAAGLAELLRSLFPERFQEASPEPAGPQASGATLTRKVAKELGALVGEDSSAPARALVRPADDDAPATLPGQTQGQLVHLVKELAAHVTNSEEVSLWVQTALLARLSLVSSRPSPKRDRILRALVKAARGEAMDAS